MEEAVTRCGPRSLGKAGSDCRRAPQGLPMPQLLAACGFCLGCRLPSATRSPAPHDPVPGSTRPCRGWSAGWTPTRWCRPSGRTSTSSGPCCPPRRRCATPRSRSATGPPWSRQSRRQAASGWRRRRATTASPCRLMFGLDCVLGWKFLHSPWLFHSHWLLSSMLLLCAVYPVVLEERQATHRTSAPTLHRHPTADAHRRTRDRRRGRRRDGQHGGLPGEGAVPSTPPPSHTHA
jgi:hypothetical protein